LTTSGGEGGKGGGIVKLKVTTLLTLNGKISSHGNNGVSGGGGGSGGSVSVDTIDMLGSGSVSVIGGNVTNSTGGGGGGGRVYLFSSGDYNYTGTTRKDSDPHTNTEDVKCSPTVVTSMVVLSPTSNSSTATDVSPGVSICVQ
jgi:hypothetical protein